MPLKAKPRGLKYYAHPTPVVPLQSLCHSLLNLSQLSIVPPLGHSLTFPGFPDNVFPEVERAAVCAASVNILNENKTKQTNKQQENI